MTHDPVVEEVRARGRALTARHGNDPEKLLQALTNHVRKHPENLVDTIKIVPETSETVRKTA
jgi:hypothetical protein